MTRPPPHVEHRFVQVDGRRQELPYLVVADAGEGEAWWRIADVAQRPDGSLVEGGFSPPLRCFTRCEPDGRIRQPIERRFVELARWERRGFFVEMLVEQLEAAKASTVAPVQRPTMATSHNPLDARSRDEAV